MAKQVVILGAGFAGIVTAHKLLKYTTPKIKSLKVILLSPNTHFFWNPAAVRGVMPGEVPDDKLFTPIATGFAHYPKDNSGFVLGRAEGIDVADNSVVARVGEGQTKIRYDILVIATGSNVGTLPIKHLGDQNTMVTELHKLQEKVKAAKSIIVVGAGPTGVETTGELGAAYGGKKDITLIVQGDRILSFMRKDLSYNGESKLRKLGVQIIHNVTVTETNETRSQTAVKLSDGQTLTASLYLPLTGVQPNTSFLPGQWKDGNGNVKVDHHLKVEGMKNAYAIGDCSNLEGNHLFAIGAQIRYLAEELDAVLTGKHGAAKKYVVNPRIRQIITMGKKTGIGQMGGWKIFGFLVAMRKGKTLFVESGPTLIEGKQLIGLKI
ncbi:hypothetical protein F5882DRAFT_479858 [Hyaloscypha sp. PMI_1271]|nr:hypothetical protein F5882DRAFT_479858 [Hyaloscypha sp. PMI_1271]